METNINLSRAIQMHNEKSVFTLKVNKTELSSILRTIGLFVVLLAYVVITLISYISKSELFSELLGAGFIVGLICFIAFHPKNKFKSKLK